MCSAFRLIDVTEMSKHNPRNYLVPSMEELNSIGIGDSVKVILRKEKNIKSRIKDERIWVKIKKLDGEKFVGVLDESNREIQKLKKDSIVFYSKNITYVNKDKKKLIDVEKNAIITCKAIEYGEINWVVKTTPFNQNDSGWQLFYGDEKYEYLDNPLNTETITIKEVLNIEPLLEDIFIRRIDSAEYNSKLNKFIEI